MDRSKVLDRVKKLLSLASNASINEKEALVANTEAQKLITRHQIDEAELNSKNKYDIELIYTRIDTKNKSDILWKNRLVCYLAEVNNCQFIVSKEDEESLASILNNSDNKYRCTIYTVFGSQSNVELIQLLFDLISNQVEYLSKNKFSGKGKSESNSYKLGVVTTVGQRLRETKQNIIDEFVSEQKMIGNTSTALVYIQKEVELVKEFVNNYYASQGITLGKAKTKKVNLKAEAYQAGLKDGRSVTINNRLALTA